MNALDLELREALCAALAAAGSDERVRCLLLTGAGERAFCAGQDIHESAPLAGADEGGWIASWHRMFGAFFDFPKPLVAGLNGVAAGGGLEIAMFCDLRVAAPHARLIMAEIDVGLPTLIGSWWVSAHLFHSRMADIVLSGRNVTAEEAHRIGLVHELSAAGDLVQAAFARAADLAAKPPHAMRLDITRFRELARAGMDRAGVFDALARYQREAMASGQPQQAMARFLAGRTRGPERSA